MIKSFNNYGGGVFCNKKSFTLSEVLINLIIIGIISAITISSLIQSTHKQEYVTKLKKADSVLKQSLYKIAVDSGYTVGDFSFMKDDEFFEYFAKNLNATIICKDGTQNQCIETHKTLNKQRDYQFSSYGALITNDGIAYGWSKDYCDKGVAEEDKDRAKCIGQFSVDVNASKNPNTIGYDYFYFLVIDGKGILPAGYGNNSADCNKNDNGFTCAAKVLKEGKITY